MSAARIERDSMGELKVPADALYGAQTQRAERNYPISGLVMPREFIREFPIDVFQTGSGTSSNMNANDVIGHLPDALPRRGLEFAGKGLQRTTFG